eukprot:14219232-Alexandrium_andersonii.AAC.1
MKPLARKQTMCAHARLAAIGAPYARKPRAMSVSNTAMPFMTRSAASLRSCPNLPRMLIRSRAESAPAPVTTVSCHAICSIATLAA